jgi:hypothetical protein
MKSVFAIVFARTDKKNNPLLNYFLKLVWHLGKYLFFCDSGKM